MRAYTCPIYAWICSYCTWSLPDTDLSLSVASPEVPQKLLLEAGQQCPVLLSSVFWSPLTPNSAHSYTDLSLCSSGTSCFCLITMSSLFSLPSIIFSQTIVWPVLFHHSARLKCFLRDFPLCHAVSETFYIFYYLKSVSSFIAFCESKSHENRSFLF